MAHRLYMESGHLGVTHGHAQPRLHGGFLLHLLTCQEQALGDKGGIAGDEAWLNVSLDAERPASVTTRFAGL